MIRVMILSLLMISPALAQALSPAARGTIVTLQRQRDHYADEQVNAMARVYEMQDEIITLKKKLETTEKELKEKPSCKENDHAD